MSKILIVDDERDLASTIAFACEQEGWQTTQAHDGRSALAAVRRSSYSVVLLDLMLPDMSGTEVCRTIRQDPRAKATPIMMLTARNDEIDRVVGFEVGADDYIGKPFSMRELMLRIKAVLRRGEGPSANEEVRFGELRIDVAAQQVWVGGDEVVLTALEFRLLWTLVSRRGRLQSREVLLGDVWGHDPDLPTRTIDTHIQRLRKKLGPASGYIETLRGAGYRFRGTPPNDAVAAT